MEIGDIILGKYEVVEKVATSVVKDKNGNVKKAGMSNIYKVRDTTLGSYWAVKEIVKQGNKITVHQNAIVQEALVMRELQHPNIPRIVTIADSDSPEYAMYVNNRGRIFIIMDWVDGQSLASWLASTGIFTPQRGIFIAKQICNILSYLHNRPIPIFYRDMKPGNVMYDLPTKKVTLLDFGISMKVAKGVPLTTAIGTEGFYAPESMPPRAKDRQNGAIRYPDLRSDIYSLGLTMFQMFTNVHPKAYKEAKLKSKQAVSGDIREYNRSASSALADIIMKCVKVDPDERFQTVEELLLALDDVQKVDRGIYKKLNRRISTFFTLVGLGVVFTFGSLIPYYLHSNGESNKVVELKNKADKSGSVEDYLNLLKLNSTDIESYLGLVEAIESDGVFSKEEEKNLLDYLNPNLPTLQKNKKYPELAFSVGKLYWLYYKGEGSEIASRWFKDAQSYSELAKVYTAIGSFKKNVITSSNEGKDSGMYKKQLNLLMDVKDESSLVMLQVTLAKVELIQEFATRLKSDGVSQDELKKALTSIDETLDKYSDLEGRQKEIYNQISSKRVGLEDKIKEAYNV